MVMDQIRIDNCRLRIVLILWGIRPSIFQLLVEVTACGRHLVVHDIHLTHDELPVLPIHPESAFRLEIDLQSFRNGRVGLPLFTAIAPGSVPLRVAAPGVAAGDEPHAVHLYGVQQAVGVTVDHAAIHFTFATRGARCHEIIPLVVLHDLFPELLRIEELVEIVFEDLVAPFSFLSDISFNCFHDLMGVNFHAQFRESQSAILQIALGDAPAVAVIGEPPLLRTCSGGFLELDPCSNALLLVEEGTWRQDAQLFAPLFV
mmetsp:Transcript_53915/g.118079  ORF Transcript_53915/g.118079 Transcript_53915/m.118079 type:complete len:259 (+) Transcript_53915:1556-2332(+)